MAELSAEDRALLRVEGVWFRYENDDEVLRDVSLTIPRGGLVGVIGPNGSGKSTLLRLLGGLSTPSRGYLTLDDDDLTSLSRRTLACRVAMVPQETQLAFEYSVLEIVMMGRYPHLGAFSIEGPDDYRIVTRALESTGTAHLSARLFTTLSGGEKQRVVIASALTQLHGPRHTGTQLLLLDEPTASLDLGFQLEITELVRTLNAQGITVIVSTHDLNLASSLCHELVLLREGRVLAAGATTDLLTRNNVRALYGVEAQMTRNAATGHTLVVPIARTQPGQGL